MWLPPDAKFEKASSFWYQTYVRRSWPLVLASMLLLGVPGLLQAHAPGVLLGGYGRAVIDGQASVDEWGGARCVFFPVNLPEGGTTSGVACAMNDDANLYLVIRFARRFVDPGNTASFEFDNDHSGGDRVSGDDVLLINPGVGFLDEVRWREPPCPAGVVCGLLDTDLGGSNDGRGAFANDGAYSVYEFSHPLDTTDDAHDFSLGPGSTVGFGLFIRLIGSNGVLADTDFPRGLDGNIDIVHPFLPALSVRINANLFQAGDVMRVNAMLTPGTRSGLVDAYVVVRRPDGQFLSLQVDGRLLPGLVPIARNLAPFHYQGELLQYSLTGEEASGEYTWVTALCEPGTHRILGPLTEVRFVIRR